MPPALPPARQKSANPLTRGDLPLREGSFRQTGRNLDIRLGSCEGITDPLTYAVSGGQALGSGASKGQQSIDDRGLAPPLVVYGEPLPLFDSSRGADSSPRDTYGLGGPPALREPCRPNAAGGLELVGLAQGKVILAAS